MKHFLTHQLVHSFFSFILSFNAFVFNIYFSAASQVTKNLGRNPFLGGVEVLSSLNVLLINLLLPRVFLAI